MDRAKIARLTGVVKDCMKVIDHHTDVVRKCISQIEDECEVQSTTNITTTEVNVRVNGVPVGNHSQNTKETKAQHIVYNAIQTIENAKRIIADPEWPKAVDEDAVCDVESPEDLACRGEQIVDNVIDRNLEGLRFLDYGCGDGYVVDAVLARGVAEAVGYDIKDQSWSFSAKGNRWYTTNFEDLVDNKCNGYDVVLLYDVLDHCEKPIDVLNRVSTLLAPGGVVYVRCQPWTSRHGGHMWRQVNKAYIHLAVDEENFKKLNYKVEPVKKILRPLRTYKEWFAQAGFKIKKEDVTTEVLENYFHKDNIKKILHRHWDKDRLREPVLNDQKINQILELEFCDFTLQQGIF